MLLRLHLPCLAQLQPLLLLLLLLNLLRWLYWPCPALWSTLLVPAPDLHGMHLLGPRALLQPHALLQKLPGRVAALAVLLAGPEQSLLGCPGTQHAAQGSGWWRTGLHAGQRHSLMSLWQQMPGLPARPHHHTSSLGQAQPCQ